MTREQEGRLFLTAMRNACASTVKLLAENLAFATDSGVVAHNMRTHIVLMPAGSQYKRCAHAVVCAHGTQVPPGWHICRSLDAVWVVYLYKDGTNGLEGTSEVATIRGEPES